MAGKVVALLFGEPEAEVITERLAGARLVAPAVLPAVRPLPSEHTHEHTVVRLGG
jgi:hypothetical protein